jgi:hypothetical protein
MYMFTGKFTPLIFLDSKIGQLVIKGFVCGFPFGTFSDAINVVMYVVGGTQLEGI